MLAISVLAPTQNYVFYLVIMSFYSLVIYIAVTYIIYVLLNLDTLEEYRPVTLKNASQVGMHSD